MNPFKDRPTQTRAPATGWASVAPWAFDKPTEPAPTARQDDQPDARNEPQESCCAASWGY
jgi:hypothetical protein